MRFNTKDDINKYALYLLSLSISEENLFIMKKFLAFSPHKFARRNGIDEWQFQKEFNSIKIPVSNAYKRGKKILQIKDSYKSLSSQIKWFNGSNIVDVRRIKSVCIKDLNQHSIRMNSKYGKKDYSSELSKFYEGVIYYYYPINDSYNAVFNEHNAINSLSKELFLEYFCDYRNWKINNILK